MKKIIREILNDLTNRPKQEGSADAQSNRQSDSANLGAPKVYEPSTKGFDSRVPKPENQGEIALTPSQPKAEDLGNTDFDAKYQAPLPSDLNNQELAADPLQQTRQLEFQAQQDEIRETLE